MPPLTQQELRQTLNKFFGWADFSCRNMPKVQSYFCHDPVPGITFTDPSMAKQAFKEEADINNIVNQYHKTGVLPQGTRAPTFGDFSSGDDFAECMERLQEAQADFDALPSSVRTEFNNDPGELLLFLEDPENRAEAIELGLVAPDPVAAPEPPKTTPPVDTKPEA